LDRVIEDFINDISNHKERKETNPDEMGCAAVPAMGTAVLCDAMELDMAWDGLRIEERGLTFLHSARALGSEGSVLRFGSSGPLPDADGGQRWLAGVGGDVRVPDFCTVRAWE
jgi:hypothetical protein